MATQSPFFGKRDRDAETIPSRPAPLMGSTTNLTGQILAELISGKHTDLSQLPIAQRRSPNWEREPLRWLAARYMQNAFLRIDEAGKRGKPKPKDAALAEFLGRH